MKRALFAGLVLVAGCLGPRADRSAFFLLTTPPTLGEGTPVPVALGLGPITLPGYLDRPQIVVRVSDNEIVLTESDRWAEPLRDNVSRTLKENLSRLLPTSSYVEFPWYEADAPDYVVVVEIRRFEADSAGTVILDATWRLTEAGRAIDGRTTLIDESAGGLERSGTVAAQSRALAELSREIAEGVRRAHARSPSSVESR